MNYEGLNAKIGAMRGRLFTAGQYESLCGLRTVEELGLTLRQAPAYRKSLENIGEHALSRAPIEQKIGLSLYEDYESLYRFISDFSVRRFLEGFFMKNEIHILKILLCTVYDEREITYSNPELSELLGQKLQIDVSRLKNSGTVSEFIDHLQGTEFHRVLAAVYTEDTPLFKLESQLDLYYYMRLWRLIGKTLDKANKKIARDLIGAEIDMQNIAWLYRLKKYYNLESHLVYTTIIPISYRLRMVEINRMAEAKNVEELQAAILHTHYGKLYYGRNIGGQMDADVEKNRGPDDFERVFFQEKLRLYRKEAMMKPQSLASALQYLFYKETEIKNIISLLEGIRYQLEPHQIIRHLHIQA